MHGSGPHGLESFSQRFLRSQGALNQFRLDVGLAGDGRCSHEPMKVNLTTDGCEGMPIRILIVDHSAIIRQAVRSCIESNTDWEVCGVAENGSAARAMMRELRPDIVVLDRAMPRMNGLKVVREIRETAPGTRMIMFTGNDCEALLKEAEDAGISKVVAKSGDGVVDHLLAAIRDVFHKQNAA
jgi:CheY-like chemotaxis protein